MKRFVVAGLCALAFARPAAADEQIPAEIGWNKSFINGRREAAAGAKPMVVLFYDRITLDDYDDVLAKDLKVREIAAGFVFIKIEREVEKDLAKKLVVKSPWEMRVLAPDLTVLKALPAKAKGAVVAEQLRAVQKAWNSRGGPKGVDWLFSHDEALRLAIETKRPLLIYFWSDLKKGTSAEENPLFKNDRVVQMSKKFHCIRVNQSVDQTLFDKYKVTEVPDILFFKPNGEACRDEVSNVKLEALVGSMEEVIRLYGADVVESGGKKEQ